MSIISGASFSKFCVTGPFAVPYGGYTKDRIIYVRKYSFINPKKFGRFLE
jgi:hypothetical protein